MVADDQRISDEPEQSVASGQSPAGAEATDSVVEPSDAPERAVSSGDIASEGSADSDVAAEETPVEEMPTEETPAEETLAEETPAEEGLTTEKSGPRQVVDAASGIVLDVAADEEEEDAPRLEWYILKVQVNREDSIRDALLRRIKIEGLEEHFADVVVPVEELAEFTKTGKRRIVKRKLYPGYILAHMVINDDTWFVVRETPGVGDFTGSAGKPTPMETREVERILRLGAPQEDGAAPVKTSIPFRSGDRVRVKDGNFQNFEGEVDTIDEANGRIVVIINIFNRSTPVELEHWQVEAV